MVKINIGRLNAKSNTSELISQQPITEITETAIQILASIPRIEYCDPAKIHRSIPLFTLKDGTVLKVWTTPILEEDYVFLTDTEGKMIFGGFAWRYKEQLKDAVEQIRKKLT